MSTFIQTLNGYLWGFPMIAFLFLTHIVMTVKTGAIQRKVFLGIKLSLNVDKVRAVKSVLFRRLPQPLPLPWVPAT